MAFGVRIVGYDIAGLSEVERCDAETAAGQKVEDSIGPPWTQDPIKGDLYPLSFGGGTPGLGQVDTPVNHLAIGTTGEDGSEGFLVERPDSSGGGLLVIAYKGFDPENPPPDPIEANAPIELAGNAVFVAGALGVMVASEFDKDHEVIFGPTVTLSDGRIFAPLQVGPEKVYGQEQTVTDVRDYDVLTIGGEVLVIDPGLTLLLDYAANVSSISLSLLLENLGTRDTIFDVIVKKDSVEVGRTSRTVNSGQLTVSETAQLVNPALTSSVFEVFVEAIGTHQKSEGFVRGAISTSTLSIRQG